VTRLADRLPDFPWDALAPYGAIARQHPDGLIDLSVGAPVDPTAGAESLLSAAAGWIRRTLDTTVEQTAILPAIGSKEMVAGLPRQLGVAPGSTVVVPRIAYPTYAVGALLADAVPVASDEPESVAGASLVWLNSPGNPDGSVLTAERMAEIVAWARATNSIVVSDECYIELGWDAHPVSVLHPDVSGGSHDRVLALYSLSKRSNLAGYRFGYLAGDPVLVSDLLAVRKHMGMMVPAPVQSAAIAALNDDDHVRTQREIYGRRRTVLQSALLAAGFRIDSSEAGLYLWITRDEPCWDTVGWFAGRGVLVTPGDFYGTAGAMHVRVALTATDRAVAGVAQRLAGA